MGCSVTDTLTALLLQLSEGGRSALLWGRQAKPHFGPAFDRLLAAGVLIECPPVEAWSVCADCDCGFGSRLIQRIDGRIVAACPIDAGSDTELEEDDLREFRIDPERLVALIAEASGFEEPVEFLAADVWRLGRLASGRFIAVATTARVLDQPGIVLLLKAAACGTPITVLVPDPSPAIRLRFLEAGIDIVELRSALEPGACGIDRLARAALEPQTDGPRLSIHLEAQAVLIDGTPQRVPSQPFNLLALLTRAARDGKGPVRNRAIEDTTGRDARDLVRELRDALSAGRPNGSELRDWIEARRSLGAFELVLERDLIEVAPQGRG
jgi:hypothetical protein